MAKHLKVQWQSWSDKIPEYKEFNYNEVKESGEYKAIERYEDCLRRFNKLSDEIRKKGIIFGGIDYDFIFEEVVNEKK